MSFTLSLFIALLIKKSDWGLGLDTDCAVPTFQFFRRVININVDPLSLANSIPECLNLLPDCRSLIYHTLKLGLFLFVLLNQLIQRQLCFVVLFDVSFSLGVVGLIQRHHHHHIHRGIKVIRIVKDWRRWGIINRLLKSSFLTKKAISLFCRRHRVNLLLLIAGLTRIEKLYDLNIF